MGKKIIKKFTALYLGTFDDTIYYINGRFDTEEEAIENAFKEDKYASWMIVPIITFEA